MSTRSRRLTRPGSSGKAAQQRGLSLSAPTAGRWLVSARRNTDTREERGPLPGTRVHVEGRGEVSQIRAWPPKGSLPFSEETEAHGGQITCPRSPS